MSYLTLNNGFYPGLSVGLADSRLCVGISSDVEYAFLPRLLGKLRAEAPGVTFSVIRVEPSRIPSMLATGEISFGIGPGYAAGCPLNKQLLRTGRSRVLRVDTAPGALSLKEFCQRPHVAVSFAADVQVRVNSAIRRQGHNRKIVMEIPNFDSLPGLLARTDCVAVVPDYVAEQLVQLGGIRSEVIPIDDADFGVYMSWQTASCIDPAGRWLRSRCSMIVGD